MHYACVYTTTGPHVTSRINHFLGFCFALFSAAVVKSGTVLILLTRVCGIVVLVCVSSIAKSNSL